MIPDEQADTVAQAVLDLAVTLRDDPDRAGDAAAVVLDAAGGDPWIALGVAAAFIPLDRPPASWWRGVCDHPGHGSIKRHRRAGEPLCGPCRAFHAGYEAARTKRPQPVDRPVDGAA